MSIEISQDGYVRLSRPGATSTLMKTPARSGAVLFVDLDCRPQQAKATVQRLREVPHGCFLGATTLLVRLPGWPSTIGYAAASDDVVEELNVLLPEVAPNILKWGVLTAEVGQPHRISWRGRRSDTPRDAEYSRRARAVELDAMLVGNHAVWHPHDYHFALPNGNHITTFVRVADGIASPRDADALAFWLQPHLVAGRGVMYDNRSLTALALAVERSAHAQGKELGPSVFLDGPSESQVEIERRVREAHSDGQGVLAVLSVSSAGTTRERLEAALTRNVPGTWHLHVLLDRGISANVPVPGEEQDHVSVWAGVRHPEAVTATGADCVACRDHRRSRVVTIDPRFFNGMILPAPTPTTIKPLRAQRAAGLWTACEEAGAVALEHPPSERALQRRRHLSDNKRTKMGVYLHLSRLIGEQVWRDKVAEGLTQMLKPSKRIRPGPPEPCEFLANVDAILVSQDDADLPGFTATIEVVKAQLPKLAASVKTCFVDPALPPEAWPEDLRMDLAGSTHVLVFALSTVTGATMQKLLVGTQEALRQADDKAEFISALVLHARLPTLREWQTLRNSYSLRLAAVFETVLPYASPLRDEQDVLPGLTLLVEECDERWWAPLRAFITERSELTNGHADAVSPNEAVPYQPLLWGMPRADCERARIRQHSLFGHRLGPAALLAAVGTCVHYERETAVAQPGPVWSPFEIPALLRSYYDPLIIAAMVRWMQPAEMWWGEDEDARVSVVLALIERAPDLDLGVLLPELLLAAAQGKVPAAAADIMRDKALRLLEDATVDDDRDIHIALAAGVLAWHGERVRRHREDSSELPALPILPVPLTLSQDKGESILQDAPPVS